MFGFPQPQLGPGIWQAGAAPPVGLVAPQPRLADGRLLDEVLGSRWAVVGGAALAACGRELAAVREAVGTGGGVWLADPAEGVAQWLDEHGALAMLLRPDRYVVGLARTPDELERLVALFVFTPPPAAAGAGGHNPAGRSWST